MAMVMATFIVLSLLIASPAAFAKDHIVGGDGGWDQSGDYTTWAAGETFTVGDNLVFNYGGNHGVDVVSKDDHDNCNAGNAVQSFIGGKTTIKLSKAGPMYFMCPTLGHCQTGMKLAINVGSATPSGGSPPSSGGTSPSTPATGGSTPSSGGTSPSTPAAGGSTPSASDSPPTTAGNSSPNAAVGSSGGMDTFMIGFSVAFGALFAFMS